MSGDPSGVGPRIQTVAEGQLPAAWLWMAALLIALGLVTRRAVLFVIAACLIAVVPFAWLWKWLSLKRVEYERVYDKSRAFPGETICMDVRITNRKILPLTWLDASDEVPIALPLVHGELEATHDPKVGLLRNVLALRWYERYVRRYELACTARGSYRLGPVQLRSGDIFTLFEESVKAPAGDPLIVYPRIWPLEELGIPSKEPFGERRAYLRLLEDPIRSVGVRDHHPEDNLRRVHWKATAHSGHLQVRVYEPAATPCLMVILNVATFEHHWQGVLPELFERAISVAGSIATWAIGQGYKTGLVANGCPSRSDQPIRVPPGRSTGQLASILEALATVTSFATSSVGTLLRHESPRGSWGATFVLVTAVVSQGICAELHSLHGAGRPTALVSLADSPPPHINGIAVYHLPPDAAVFGERVNGANDSAAALEAAGLSPRRTVQSGSNGPPGPRKPRVRGISLADGTGAGVKR